MVYCIDSRDAMDKYKEKQMETGNIDIIILET